jgi:hypothetical protein
MRDSQPQQEFTTPPDSNIRTIMYGGEEVHLKTVNDDGGVGVEITDPQGNPLAMDDLLKKPKRWDRVKTTAGLLVGEYDINQNTPNKTTIQYALRTNGENLNDLAFEDLTSTGNSQFSLGKTERSITNGPRKLEAVIIDTHSGQTYDEEELMTVIRALKDYKQKKP